MPRKNHLMLVILLALLLTLVIIVFAPFAVSNGVRFWIWWRARQEGFVVSVEGIDAPFLSPLVIHEIHLKSTRDNALRRSEEHTSELQSRSDLVCRLLLEKKKVVTTAAPMSAVTFAPDPSVNRNYSAPP